MVGYTKAQFEDYKGDRQFLTVSYEYPKGNWEQINHENYEDYINTFNSYVSINRENKELKLRVKEFTGLMKLGTY